MKATNHRRVFMHIVVREDTDNGHTQLFPPYMTFFIE